MTWYEGRMLTFDTETDCPTPEVAHVVQYGGRVGRRR
jgi:hypothetical protein